MNSTEIIEGNKLIAEFMGHDVYKDDGYIIPSNKYGISESDMMQHCFTFSVKNDGNIDKFREEHISCGGYYFVVSDFKLKYNSSWDWLMPVIDKIESLGFYSKISGCATSICHYCWFDDGEDNKDIVIGYNSKTDESKINTVFIACINFIVKYNNNFIK